MYIYIKMKMKALNIFLKLVVIGGSAAFAWDEYSKRYFHGVSGNHGTLRRTGGGGSGGCTCEYYSSYSGRGGNGTSYSGGAGGGSSTRLYQQASLNGKPGSDIGGHGGAPDYNGWARIWSWKSRSK